MPAGYGLGSRKLASVGRAGAERLVACQLCGGQAKFEFAIVIREVN